MKTNNFDFGDFILVYYVWTSQLSQGRVQQLAKDKE